MEDVKWFSKEDVKNAVKRSSSADFQSTWNDSTELKVPPPVALAHVLIRAWAESN